MNRKLLIKVLMLFVFFLGMGSSMYAQFLINENFRGKITDSKNNIIMGGDPKKAFLTAAGANGDPEGEGWIRLNADSRDQKGFFYVNQAFPSEKGVFVDFEYKTWRSNEFGYGNYTDGDGIGVFLFDGSISETDFALGGYGGSLGYAPMNSIKGLNGGYIGLGIDEFGNYSGTADGKQGLPGNEERQYKHRLALRGKTDRSVASNKSNLLLYSGALVKADHGADKVGYTTVTKTRPSDQTFYRRVQIEINPIVKNKKVVGSKVIVRWAVKKGGAFYKVMEQDYMEIPPSTLKIGFAASTGGAINFHEVRDLFATTPGGVKIEKTADKSLVNVGEDLTYTITLKGQNAKDLKFNINDDLNAIKDFFKVESIAFVNNGNGSTSSLQKGALTLKDIEVTLKQLGTVSFVIKGKVLKAQSNGMLENTATIDKTTLPVEVQNLVTPEQLISTTTTQVIDPNFCGCPEGAKQMVSGTGITVNSGDIYCVSGNVSIGSLTIDKGGVVYVQEGAKLSITGNYKQDGGIVSVCPYGGVFITASATFGIKDGGDTKLVLKENAYFSVTGSLTHNDPSNGKAIYEMYGNSFIEVCATYSQAEMRYPSVEYKGTDGKLAYFINKGTVSGSVGSTISDSNKIAWITFLTPAHITPGKALYCDNASPTSCAYWPKGLNPDRNKCAQVEELIDRTEPVGPDFCDYPGDKFISGYHSTIIKTATGFQIFGEQTKPSGKADEHFLVPTDITFANGFNYEGSPLMATLGSNYYSNNQNFLLTTKGLYVWGGRLGAPTTSSYYTVIHPDLVKDDTFQKIELPTGVTPKDVKYITASHNVLAVLLNNGQIKISGTKATLYGDGISTLNKEWHTVSTKGNTPLLNVEMMKMHATGGIALTKDGKYYAWGTTVFDGVKRIDNSNYSYAVAVKAPFTSKPVMLGITGSAEDKYVSYFALSEDGKVYSLGNNNAGQLGIGDITESLIWQVVKKEDGTELTDIKYLSAQDNSSYQPAAGAINKFGRVYFWGSNDHNMLGQSSGGNLHFAKEPQGLNDNRVVYVEVGGHTGMIVNDQNKYCYVGHKVHGSMGDGIDAGSTVHTLDCENTPNVINMCGKIEIVPEPGLTIIKDGVYIGKDNDKAIKAGGVIKYTIKVTNTGNTLLSNIEVTDPKLPNFIAKIVSLNPGEIREFSTNTDYVVKQEDIERGGVFNQAEGKGNIPTGPVTGKSKPTTPISKDDPNYPLEDPAYPNCETCTVTILEQQPSITLVKVGVVDEDADTAAGNGVINYTFTITNTGNVSLTLKDFKDSIINPFKPKFGNGEGTGSLEVGKTWTATATYTITDADVEAENVTNQATVKGTAPKGKEVEAKSGTEVGNNTPTITPVEGGGPLMTNPHIYHKVQ